LKEPPSLERRARWGREGGRESGKGRSCGREGGRQAGRQGGRDKGQMDAWQVLGGKGHGRGLEIHGVWCITEVAVACHREGTLATHACGSNETKCKAQSSPSCVCCMLRCVLCRRAWPRPCWRCSRRRAAAGVQAAVIGLAAAFCVGSYAVLGFAYPAMLLCRCCFHSLLHD
jgi:hypothetical protein